MTPAEPFVVERLDADHDLAAFSCGQDALDRWLLRTARTAAAAGTAATYVMLDGRRHVVGFYALAIGSVGHSEAPSRLRRGMPDPVPVVVLARLAIAQEAQGSGLGGALLVDALRRAVRGGRELGARAVVVDATDDRAAAFYAHFGLVTMAGARLWQRLSWIARAVEHRATGA